MRPHVASEAPPSSCVCRVLEIACTQETVEYPLFGQTWPSQKRSCNAWGACLPSSREDGRLRSSTSEWTVFRRVSPLAEMIIPASAKKQHSFTLIIPQSYVLCQGICRPIFMEEFPIFWKTLQIVISRIPASPCQVSGMNTFQMFGTCSSPKH